MLLPGVLSGCALKTYTPAPLAPDAIPRSIAAARLDGTGLNDLLWSVTGQAPRAPTAWSCAELGIVAAHRSHAVVAAQAAVRAAAAGREAAGLPPPLQVQLALEHHSDRNQGDGSRISIGPAFTYTWQRVDRRRIARELAGVDVLTSRAAVLEAAWNARDRACTEALRLGGSLVEGELFATQADLLDAAAALAREQTEAGLNDGYEWQSLMLEANALQLRRLRAASDTLATRGALAGALNLTLPALSGMVPAQSLDDAMVPDQQALRTRALTHHPSILAALADYERAERALELAVAAQYPDFKLSPGYFFDQGDNVWSLLGGLVLPLFAHQDRRIARAVADRDSARAQFERAQSMVINRLQEAYVGHAALAELAAGAGATLAELEGRLTELAAQSRLGAIDPLVLKRAEIQRNLVRLELIAIAEQRRTALLELERAAAWPFSTPAFAAYLEHLYRDDVSNPGVAQ